MCYYSRCIVKYYCEHIFQVQQEGQESQGSQEKLVLEERRERWGQGGRQENKGVGVFLGVREKEESQAGWERMGGMEEYTSLLFEFFIQHELR